LRKRGREKALDFLEHHKPEPLSRKVQQKLNKIAGKTGT
jgi:hypothetical protein